MEFLTILWLPILLSAVFVFVASSIIHMAMPGWHKSEYQKLPGEANLMEAMRKEGVAPGGYAFPAACSMKEMGEPEMVAKYEAGPVGFMTVVPNGPPAMAKSLVQWFLYSLMISVFAGYLGWFAIGSGGAYLDAFRITGTVAVLGYGATHVVDSIWKGAPWIGTMKHVIDGIIFGLLTAGAFGWLWPA